MNVSLLVSFYLVVESFNTKKSLSAGNLDLFDGGNDLGCEELEGFQVGHIGQTDNRLVNAHRRQLAEIGNGGCRSPALLPAIPGEMNTLNDGFLDVRIRAAYSLAVLAQDGELALRFVEPQSGQRKIAGIAILRHQSERLALTCPADQDGRMGPLDALGRIERALKCIVLTVVGLFVTFP